jgi:hypothetical protein
VAVDIDRAQAARPRWGQAPRRVRAEEAPGSRARGSASGATSGWPAINRGTLLVEKGEFVTFQREPDDGRPERGRPGGVYIIVAAIVAITIIVLLIILIF